MVTSAAVLACCRRAVLTTVAAVIGMTGAKGADTAQRIIHPSFHTLTVRHSSGFYAPPVVNLGTGDYVEVSFDEIAEERRYLRYRLIHCNADWQPSALVESEYLDGFNIADIDDYAYSRATAAHYVHYSFSVPNARMSPILSGNYVIEVFDEDEPSVTLLRARMMLSENSAKIDGDVTSRTDIGANSEYQQLNVVVDAERADVADMFNDMQLYVIQNGRTDRQVMLRHPLRVSGRRAFYEHQRPLVFTGGNEYRRMEIVSTTYPGMGVDALDYAEPFYHAELTVDYPRDEERYVYDEDQAGRFFIREYNSDDSDVEADYIVTHFTLEMPCMSGVDVYLEGDLTDRRFDSESRMNYDSDRGSYVKSMLLKQGAYNYQYVTVPPVETIEGNFYQTVNEYTVLLYYRAPMARYDRLIGATVIYSGK